MGWLAELAQSHGHSSLRALALALKDSACWPSKEKRDVETVANRLREADKGKDTSWWTAGKGRPFLTALAEFLQEDESELVARLQRAQSATANEAPTLWPFRVFPALSPLNLRSEDLFPGLPSEIARPGGPRAERMWWVAPTGAGKTLAGRWLEQQFGWTLLQNDRWADLDLPPEGRLYVALASTEGITAEALSSLPKTLKLCVACPSLPSALRYKDAASSSEDRAGSSLQRPERRSDIRDALMSPAARPPDRHTLQLPAPPGSRDQTAGSESEDDASPGFHVVYSPPPHKWARPLIQWAAGRVKPGGGFDRERLARLFGDPGLPSLFETPGDLLAFLGMVDEVGLDWVDDTQRPTMDLLRWVRAWLKAALGRQDRRIPEGVADLLGKHGPEILLDTEIQRVRRRLGRAMPEATWIELVPRAQVPEVDRDRLLAALDEPEGDVRARLRAMLAPDGASVVAGLRATGALAENDAGNLLLRPAWVANAIGAAATDRLYHEAPDGLGALLLASRTSELALRRLIKEVRSGSTDLVAACVQPTARAPSPEQMAAINGAFRAIGIALADGAELPLPLVRAAWERQMEYAFRPFGQSPPAPLLHVGTTDHTSSTPTSLNAWFLAALAISRALVDASINIAAPALNPWAELPTDASERAACLEALDNAASAFHTDEEIGEPEPLRLAVYRLGGALLDRHGILRRGDRLLDLQGPDLLVALATGTSPELDHLERAELLHLHFGLTALDEACRRRSVPSEQVLAWCWSTWGQANDYWPPTEWARFIPASRQHLERIWKAASADALSNTLFIRMAYWPKVWPFLTDVAWARWLEVLAKDSGRYDAAAEIFRFVPERLALDAMRDGRVDLWSHDVRRILWERMPGALLGLIDELSQLPPQPHPRIPNYAGPIRDLVASAPAKHRRAIVEQARAWLAAPASYPGVGAWLGWWLARTVDERSPGWLEAYELLLASAGRL